MSEVIREVSKEVEALREVEALQFEVSKEIEAGIQ